MGNRKLAMLRGSVVSRRPAAPNPDKMYIQTMITCNKKSTHSRVTRPVWVALIASAITLSFAAGTASAQKRRPVRHLPVCGNPTAPCKTIGTFQPYDLPFRLPTNAVIYDTDLFYAVILKSVSAKDDTCDVFVSEDERLAAQALFPDHKVFSSRCTEPGGLSYSNTNPDQHFMAVFAGMNLAEANRMLAAVKATGKFPGSNVRRMRAVMNGT
jgi:hypothetical protein